MAEPSEEDWKARELPPQRIVATLLHWWKTHAQKLSRAAVLELAQQLSALLTAASGSETPVFPADTMAQLQSPFRKLIVPPERWAFCGHCPEDKRRGRHVFKFTNARCDKLLADEAPVCSRCEFSPIDGRMDAAGVAIPYARPVHAGDMVPP